MPTVRTGVHGGHRVPRRRPRPWPESGRRRAGSKYRRSERFWLSTSRSVCRRLGSLSSLGLSLAPRSLSAATAPSPMSRLLTGKSGSGPAFGRDVVACCRRCCVVAVVRVCSWSVGSLQVWLSAEPVLVIEHAGRLGCGRYCPGCGRAEFGRPARDVEPGWWSSGRSSAGMRSGTPRGGGTKTGYVAGDAVWAWPRRARR
jgi:hypothetical protein